MQKRVIQQRLLIVVVALGSTLFFTGAVAEEAQKEEAEDSARTLQVLERVTVVGTRERAEAAPGAAFVFDSEDLEAARIGIDDIQRVLAQVPGVNIREEEGYGRRPNIGLRGTSVERSRAITLMEDSVLSAPAPYAAPAAYYFPPIGRMAGMEVLKGAAQIKYGPRTLGGSLNLFSTPIPDRLSLRGSLAGGSDQTYKGHLNLGHSYRYGGWLLEGYQLGTDGFKRLDDGGDTGFTLRDLVGKVRLNTDPSNEIYQQLEFKINDFVEDSNETYLGLTREDFKRDPYRRYAASQRDLLDVEHQQYQLRHFIELGNDLDITSTLYRNNTARSWYRIISASGVSISDIVDDPQTFSTEYGYLTGETSPAEAILLRDAARDYFSRGLQSIVTKGLSTGDIDHRFEVGLRYHQDEEDRFERTDLYQMVNGALVLDQSGEGGSSGNRVDRANAWALHIQDEITYSDFKLIPGLRYERIRYQRRDYGREDATRSGESLKRDDNTVTALIPGAGLHWQITEEIGSFMGISKGFSPPGAAGPEVKEESSINYEIGATYRNDYFQSATTLFWNDYSNLLGADTLAAGGSGSGDLFNAGEATAMGVEYSLSIDPGAHHNWAVNTPIRANYTYTRSRFDSDFVSGLFGSVTSGDPIPYIPEHQGYLSFGINREKIGSIELRSRYVDAMPTFPGASKLGSDFKTDSYLVFDATATVPVAEKAAVFLDVMNLFDKEYIVARQPAGARPGLPLTIMAGVKFSLD